MALRKYKYTYNGVPYSYEADFGMEPGTEVIDLGELGNYGSGGGGTNPPNNSNFTVYTKTAFGFSGGSSFSNLDFEILELLDLTGMIINITLDDPNRSLKMKALNGQFNKKLLDYILKEAQELERTAQRYASTYGGNYGIVNEIKKTLGYVSSASSLLVPILASNAASVASAAAIASGASAAVAASAGSAAGAALAASFTGVFSSVMPILGLAIVGLSIVERQQASAGKASLEAYMIEKKNNIEDSLKALGQKIKSETGKEYLPITIPEISDKELQDVLESIKQTPISNYYSAPASNKMYWIALAVVLFLLFLIIRRRQRQ